MGKLEQGNKRRRIKRDLQGLILNTIALSGTIGIALVAPNVIVSMRKLGLTPTRRQEESINTARNRLIEKGYLSRNKNGNLELTPKGKLALIKKRPAQKKTRKWDRKWRILIFDIPNNRRGLRDKIRKNLYAVGFTLLQDSVWVYPYACDDLIALLKSELKIGKDMRYIIADTIEGDSVLKKHFGLKK